MGRVVDDVQLREQTARNVAAVEHEQRGEWDAAVALYEANVAEGFPGDWPYARLALIYSQRQQPTDKLRVLERAVEVFSALPRSHPQRAPRLTTFRARLQEARRALAPARGRRRARAAEPPA